MPVWLKERLFLKKLLRGVLMRPPLFLCVLGALGVMKKNSETDSSRKGRGSEMVKKFALLGFSICFMVLYSELLVRYIVPAWPFETVLYTLF